MNYAIGVSEINMINRNIQKILGKLDSLFSVQRENTHFEVVQKSKLVESTQERWLDQGKKVMFSNREYRANCITAEDKFLAFNASLDAEHSQSHLVFYYFCFFVFFVRIAFCPKKTGMISGTTTICRFFFFFFFYSQTVSSGAGRFQLKGKWRRFVFF